jgi:serine/threonine protein kinase
MGMKRVKGAPDYLCGEGMEKYSIPKEPLGKGGNFAEPYALESPDPNAPALIMKVLKSPTDEGFEEMAKEAKVYEQIGDHPNIAKCLGVTTVGGQKGLVMERVQGNNSEKVLKDLRTSYDKGEISHEEFWGVVQFITARVLQTVDYMASRGVAHNDIKPDNIMLDAETGEVKLIDFGAAAQIGHEPEQGTNVPIGAGVVAPELMLGEQATPKWDVFGTGALVFGIGEQCDFKYGDDPESLKSEQDRLKNQGKRAADYAKYKDEGPLKPVQPEDASKLDDQGGRTKRPGKYVVDTAYTNSLNRLMDPDPAKRLTASQALQEEFMTEPLLGEDQARAILKKLLAPQGPPRLDELDEVKRAEERLQAYVGADREPLTGKAEEVTRRPGPERLGPTTPHRCLAGEGVECDDGQAYSPQEYDDITLSLGTGRPADIMIRLASQGIEISGSSVRH